ncbi:MAG: ABC transporter ATP-binding protein [Mycoplasma sp.]
MNKLEFKTSLRSLNNLFQLGLLTKDEFDIKEKMINQQFEEFCKNYEEKSKTKEKKPLIVVENLTKHYKGREKPAINKLNFKIYPGEFHVFIGANGAGKTTAIKSIIGAYSKKSIQGNITIDGKELDTVEAKMKLGYIPESAIFPKKMKTKDYLSMMSMMSGYSWSDSVKLADNLLKKLNMSKFANKCPDSFSSGQKKKILLAQSLIHNPSILIMDEPAANLDPQAREELFELLVELQKEGKAIFLSSHILDEVGKYASYVTIVDGGEIVFDGEISPNDDLSELYRDFVVKGSVDNCN